MTRRYHELIDDLHVAGRWHLDGLRDNTGIELDSREFSYGNYIGPGPPLRVSLWNEDKIINVTQPLRMSWSREGTPLDFTFTDDDVPVVTKPVADLLSQVAGADIQKFPIKIDKVEQEYEIINIVSRIKCIDATRSKLEWWTEEYGRPDLLGKALTIIKLVVDPCRIGDAHMFRLEESTITVIVSDVIKQALEEANVSGIKFKELL